MNEEPRFDALMCELSGFRSVATAIRNSYQLTKDKTYACVDDELRNTLEWRPIETAPKDHPILAWCQDTDKCGGGECNGRKICEFHYQANALSAAEPGFNIVVFGGEDYDDDSGTTIQSWWFVQHSNFEVAANPIYWMPLPEPPGDAELTGRNMEQAAQ